ncbi:MAG TPA: M23 family metallopeptidase [Gammaproteobacteria bacterium]
MQGEPSSPRTARAPRVAVALVVGLALALAPLLSEQSLPAVELAPYTPRSPHHAYGFALAGTRLARNPAGLAWLAAGERAVSEPVSVATPYEAAGSFAPGEAQALGVRFSVPEGRRVRVDVEVDAAAPVEVFVDLFEAADGRAPRPVATLPPGRFGPGSFTSRALETETVAATDYIVRLQPELAAAGHYRLRIRTTPLLVFPVDGHDIRAIQSGFGAARDGGARAHRGVDIFAARGTPALAAADAWVTRVETTPRGGNVVWLQPLFGNMRLYYAHLDTQLVRPGDFVLAGEPVGTVGNTGNARTTPPHLHFGVYFRPRGVRGGARDPYPLLAEVASRR